MAAGHDVRRAGPSRRLAQSLVRCAAWLLPSDRSAWAQAMAAEIDALPSDGEALRWAVGCITASSKVRLVTMLVGKLHVSRWVLVPEMLLCFVPLVLLLAGAATSVAHLRWELIPKYFLVAPGAALLLLSLFAGVIVGLLGPIALVAAFRLVVLHRPLRNRWVRATIVTGPALYGVLVILDRLALGGLANLSPASPDFFDFVSAMVLLSCLPALGAAHLLHLGGQPMTKALSLLPSGSRK
jgi:hypothetical protein